MKLWQFLLILLITFGAGLIHGAILNGGTPRVVFMEREEPAGEWVYLNLNECTEYPERITQLLDRTR